MKNHVRYAGLFVSGIITIFAASPAALSADKVSIVSLKANCSSFAINPDTGDVIGVDSTAETAWLYPSAFVGGKSATVVGPVKLGLAPASVVFKRYKTQSYFVVGCRQQGAVFVLASKTLKIIKKITVSSGGVGYMSTSRDADDPPLLFATPRGTRNPICSSVNLATGKQEAVIGASATWPLEAITSADGRWMYTRSSGSPSGFKSFRRIPTPGQAGTKWEAVTSEHRTSGRYYPDPFGAVTANSRMIYSADLAKVEASLNFTPMSFFTTKPVIVGISGGERMAIRSRTLRKSSSEPAIMLHAASYNDFKALGSVELPLESMTTKESTTSRRSPSRLYRVIDQLSVMPDDKQSRVIVGRQSVLAVVKLKTLGYGGQPLMLARHNAPANAFVGQKLRIAIVPYDLKCSVKLKDAPSGAVLSGNVLRWTPTPENAGSAAITLEFTDGKSKAIQVIPIEVTQPSVRFSFTPTAIDISPDGSSAVAWGTTSSGARRYPPHSSSSMSQQLAVVDFNDPSAVRMRTLPYRIADAAVCGDHVYVAPIDSDRIISLSRKDLSKTGYVATASRVSYMVIASDKKMIARCRSSRPVILDLPSLKSRGKIKPSTGSSSGYGSRDMAPYVGRQYGDLTGVKRLQSGWCIRGVLFDGDLTKARCLAGVSSMLSLGPFKMSTPAPLPWDRAISGTSVRTSRNHRITTLPTARSVLMTDYPALVSLVSEPDGSNKSYVTSLSIRDAVAGENIVTIPLAKTARPIARLRHQYGYSHHATTHLLDRGNHIYALVGDTIYATAIPETTLAKFAKPFQVQWPDISVSPISTTGVTRIAHKTSGGKGAARFEPITAVEGLSMSAKTGTLSVDGAVLLKAARAKILDLMKAKTRYSSKLPDAGALVASTAAHARSTYTEATGLEIKGIPIGVPVTVAASDEKNHTTAISYQLVVSVPMDGLVKAVAAQFAETAKERKAAAARSAALLTQGGQAMERRVESLEREVRMIKAMLRQLLEKESKQK